MSGPDEHRQKSPGTMRRLVTQLHQRRRVIEAMGGPEKIREQHQAGKLTARERLARLLDEGTFRELGGHASSTHADGHHSPADGVIGGFAECGGRVVAVAAWDFTVRDGRIGAAARRKLLRLVDAAEHRHAPLVWLLDSMGPRTGTSKGADQAAAIAQFADSGHLLRAQLRLAGRIPQVAAVLGPARSEAAWIAGLCDFVLMVRGTSTLALGGANLVRAAIGEKITDEDLGGARIHALESGVADLDLDSEEECLDAVKDLLSHLSSPVIGAPLPAEDDPAPDLLDDAVLDLLPEERSGPWDVYTLLEAIADGGRLFELMPERATNAVTAFGRLGGRTVGFVAHDPRPLSGVIDSAAADKITRFVNRCSDHSVPLIFLCDTPGFLVGSEAERGGILRHGATLLRAVSEARVPRLSVIVRRAYGAGYYAMCGRAFAPNLLVAWPTAEISVLGPEGIVSVAMPGAIANAGNPSAERARLAEAIRPQFDIFHAAERGFVDDVIDPRETRQVLLAALSG